ncbi:MAG TPA: carboxypeptidase regulatory-like domain-containing protein [Gemmatimonadaceae bacterium]|jgi:hypothetical protein|nr:carboxypeptidase regulatory-like domain-containing protein [Gemmatimonadaceae bacterium]
MVRLAVCACLAFWAISAHAQAPAAPSPSQRAVAEHSGEALKDVAHSSAQSSGQGGVLVGIVVDSLHDGPLAGALVTVVQLPRRSVMTSPSGAFRLDSLPPGKYTLDIQHPVIDSLGIQVRSDTLLVAAGQTQTAFLSVPSPARIAATICSPLQQHLGPAVLVGQVLDADAGTPMAGAEVSIVWLETQASLQTGVHTIPHLRKATVAPDGTFRVCGLPATLNATLQASLGETKTGEIALETNDQPLTLKVLHLPSSQATVAIPAASPSPTQAPAAAVSASSASPVALQTGHAVVTGRVTNKGGVPAAGAAVTIQGGAAKTTSAKDGTFTLSEAPAGTQLVLVRLVGYDPVQLPLEITTRGPNTLTVRLGEYHPQLATVNVRTKAPQTALDRTGFTRRKNTGIGHYVTEDDIAREQPVFTSDLLRQVMGLHVFGSGQSVSITTSRGEGCVRYLVDRNNINPDDGLSIDELVHPADIVGIEFYQASEIPAALSSGANSGCALLVVWTRQKLSPTTSNP